MLLFLSKFANAIQTETTQSCGIMKSEEINIDEQLSILWGNVYDAILSIIDNRYSRECKVELPNSLLLSYVLVTYDAVLAECIVGACRQVFERTDQRSVQIEDISMVLFHCVILNLRSGAKLHKKWRRTK